MENITTDRVGETNFEEAKNTTVRTSSPDNGQGSENDHGKNVVSPEVLQFTGNFEQDRKLVISAHMRELQKKSAEARKRNDPNTYKKMRALREEKKVDLKIVIE